MNQQLLKVKTGPRYARSIILEPANKFLPHAIHNVFHGFLFTNFLPRELVILVCYILQIKFLDLIEIYF